MKLDASLFRLLGDEARLRLLRLLSLERLNVTELTAILGLAQSGVSRHLGLLKDAGIVVEQRARRLQLLRPVRRAAGDGTNGSGALSGLLMAQFAASRRRRPRVGPTPPASRRSGGFARRTSTSMARATNGARSCPAGAGPPGPGRSATCCRRSMSRTSDAAKAIWPWRRAGSRGE